MIPRGNKEGLVDFYNGAILEDHSVAVTSDGSIVTLTLDAKNGRDFLSLLHEGDFHKLSVPATVTLSVGTDTAPVLNYIYIPHSTETLTAEVAIEWPTVEQITPIATCLVQSAASVQTDGAYKVHAWTDHITDTIGQGHLTHINKWIRKQNATWLDGTAMSFSGGGTATVEAAVTSGHVLQLHQQSFPALLNPMFFNVINDFVTPYIQKSN